AEEENTGWGRAKSSAPVAPRSVRETQSRRPEQSEKWPRAGRRSAQGCHASRAETATPNYFRAGNIHQLAANLGCARALKPCPAGAFLASEGRGSISRSMAGR